MSPAARVWIPSPVCQDVRFRGEQVEATGRAGPEEGKLGRRLGGPVARGWLVLLLAGLIAQAQGFPSQIGLGGFQLGQYLRTADATYKVPRLEGTQEDGWLVKAFTASLIPEVNIVFQCPPGDPRQIVSIQVAGDPASGFPLVSGLRLGMDEKAVVAILGHPKERKAYQDEGVDYLRLDFGDRNYSCEFDGKGRLISFMLFGYTGFAEKPGDLPTLSGLKAALKAGDMPAFGEILAPDFELYRGRDLVSYQKAAALDLKENGQLKGFLLGPGGLKEALERKDADEDFQMRLSEEKGGVKAYSVCKFPKSPLLKEIVFTFLAGKWRIYEVAFREQAPPGK